MKVTREKRPDRIICKWEGYEVKLDEEGKVEIWGPAYRNLLLLTQKDVRELIKALEITLDTK